MPDSTNFPPVRLAAWRDHARRASELDTAATHRTPLGDVLAAAARPAPARRPANATPVRVERRATRWRDVQWVDFTSDPDSGEDSPPQAGPVPPPPVEPVRRAAPELGHVMRRFSEPVAAAPNPPTDAISGLAPRFTRVPVQRPAPIPKLAPALRPGAARSSLIEPYSVPPIVEPEPLEPAAPSQTAALWPMRPPEEAVAPPLAVAAASPLEPPSDTMEPIAEPPLSATVATLEVAAYGGSRIALSERFVIVGLILRGIGAGLAAAVSNGVPRVRITPSRPLPIARTLPSRHAVVTRVMSAIGRTLRYLAAKANALRVSGLAALTAVFIALAAYGGGAWLARAVGSAAGDTGSTAASTSSAATRQMALADKIVHPLVTGAVLSPANVPPSDPAARAAFYLTRAKSGDAAAQYDVAVLYARGDGLVQDYASAATWFHAAAAQGNVAAEFNLGVLYERGLGVTANQTEALNWYRSAADQNHAGAQFNLALAYANGTGTKQDTAAAARWYKRAAEAGLAPAMVNLAILNETGNGIALSQVDAYAWYSAAGERGDAVAKARAADLFRQFNDRDKARAQGLAATIGAALDQLKPPPEPAPRPVAGPTAAPRA